MTQACYLKFRLATLAKWQPESAIVAASDPPQAIDGDRLQPRAWLLIDFVGRDVHDPRMRVIIAGMDLDCQSCERLCTGIGVRK
jgi:hypothetical protein